MIPPENAAAVVRLLLYVADDTQNSVVAVDNLTAICEAHLPGRHTIEVVDVFQQPDRALADRVFMTPTLIRLAPLPVRRIVGTLSQQEKVLHALGLGPVRP
ncbi:MAG: circadian clock KaiB family protein [Verrucomicrobia bacterium]|nr:circadian clock KaiB family protein [Verrucomicrobiota bacterium]